MEPQIDWWMDASEVDEEVNRFYRQRLEAQEKNMREQPRFKVGDRVDYFKRGICYSGIVREDLGILKGAGRRYRITPPDGERDLEYFVFNVAERWLCEPIG